MKEGSTGAHHADMNPRFMAALNRKMTHADYNDKTAAYATVPTIPTTIITIIPITTLLPSIPSIPTIPIITTTIITVISRSSREYSQLLLPSRRTSAPGQRLTLQQGAALEGLANMLYHMPPDNNTNNSNNSYNKTNFNCNNCNNNNSTNNKST